MPSIKRFFSAGMPVWAMILSVVALCAAGVIALVLDYRHTINTYVVAVAGEIGTDPLVFGPQPTLAKEDFFKDVKDSFVAQRASFVEANLSDMKLTVYKEGVVVTEVDILAKGREGSWWETPAGLYKIETKEKNHFSSFGKVYQPWSMAFQGNFFIHGWPYYPGGEPVASTFSGGCIRLSDEDAEKVFGLVEKNMPVLVFEKDFARDDFSYEAHRPAIAASNYLAADLKNNFVFVEKGSRSEVPLGRMTELVTALISAEYINLDKEVVFQGGTVTAINLLYPVMLETDERSDEAAQALADILGESWAVKLMNDKVKALGMEATHFSEPIGADLAASDNTSTAEDMFSLAKYVFNNRSFILKMSTGNLTWSVYGSPAFTDLGNENLIEGMPLEFVGGKFDSQEIDGQVRENFIGIYNREVRGEKRPVAIIVFDSPDAKRDARVLADYILANYK